MYEQVEKIYLLYYHDLYRYILSLCPNVDMAEDIIQSTFLEALKSIESFQSRSSIKTWLFSIARHQTYQQLKKNKRHVNIDEWLEKEPSSQIDMGDKLLAQQILEALNALTPPLKDIVQLRLIYGLSFKEIGLRVGKTENYCRVNFFRIKEKLRKEYRYE